MSDEQETSGEVLGTISGKMLRESIERIQRLESEKTQISSDIKEIYATAKSEGLDTKIMKKIVAILKDSDGNSKREEFETLLDTYLAALGVIDRD
jgi:uncharacterized protein (UPF0335 family)